MTHTKEMEWFTYPDVQPHEGQKVLVAGGVAEYRDGTFYSGMEAPLFRRPIEWNVNTWANMPFEPDMSNARVIAKCIDMDEWKHSWHNALESEKDFLLAKEVIQDKISKRILELSRLRHGLDVVSKVLEDFNDQEATGKDKS